MKRTDKEIIEAMTFIKEQHNGEMPYQFGTFECAKMMAKYLKEQLTIPVVVGQSEQLKCVWCGNDESKDILPQLCNECFKKGCKAF
jgi:hypothetical protein